MINDKKYFLFWCLYMLQIFQFNKSFIDKSDTASVKIPSGVYDKRSFFEINNAMNANLLTD